jgi:hypothetical protein
MGKKIHNPLIIIAGINFSLETRNDVTGPQKVVWKIWQATKICKITFPFSTYKIENISNE